MKDTTKLGLYFIMGVILLVVPVTYTLTIMRPGNVCNLEGEVSTHWIICVSVNAFNLDF